MRKYLVKYNNHYSFSYSLVQAVDLLISTLYYQIELFLYETEKTRYILKQEGFSSI